MTVGPGPDFRGCFVGRMADSVAQAARGRARLSRHGVILVGNLDGSFFSKRGSQDGRGS